MKFNREKYIKDLKNASVRAVNKQIADSLDNYLLLLQSHGILNMDERYLGMMKAAAREVLLQPIDDGYFGALSINPFENNEAFRLIYYEYGTGEYAMPPKGYSPSNDPYWNPGRPIGERRIYSRGRDTNGPTWTDMGGNVRKAKARTSLPLKSTSPNGMPIHPTFAAQKAGATLRAMVLEELRKISLEISPTAYIKLRAIRKKV